MCVDHVTVRSEAAQRVDDVAEVFLRIALSVLLPRPFAPYTPIGRFLVIKNPVRKEPCVIRVIAVLVCWIVRPVHPLLARFWSIQEEHIRGGRLLAVFLVARAVTVEAQPYGRAV